MKAIVITTISSKPTEALRLFAKIKGYSLILVGDVKSPKKYNLNCTYLPIDTQHKIDAQLSKELPLNHYARKNIGYVYAIKAGAELIAESDDDNLPYETWGSSQKTICTSVITEPELPNIYKLFTNKKIWPRGFPVEKININEPIKTTRESVEIGVWQSLADGDPDVDALYRLILGESVIFEKEKDVALGQNSFCAFNSQNTLWFPKSFTYMYLPSTVTFRYTDILRSYVAQFGLRARGLNIGFTKATCFQERNKHSLIQDLKSELPMYSSTLEVISLLKSIHLTGQDSDILIMYKALVNSGIVHADELNLVESWLNAIS